MRVRVAPSTVFARTGSLLKSASRADLHGRTILAFREHSTRVDGAVGRFQLACELCRRRLSPFRQFRRRARTPGRVTAGRERGASRRDGDRAARRNERSRRDRGIRSSGLVAAGDVGQAAHQQIHASRSRRHPGCGRRLGRWPAHGAVPSGSTRTTSPSSAGVLAKPCSVR